MPQSILASLNTLLNTSKCPFELQFSLHKCPKPSWQAFWPPHNQANAHLNIGNSSLNKYLKPQTILASVETPPPIRAMPIWIWRLLAGSFPYIDKLLQQMWTMFQASTIHEQSHAYTTMKKSCIFTMGSASRWSVKHLFLDALESLRSIMKGPTLTDSGLKDNLRIH